MSRFFPNGGNGRNAQVLEYDPQPNQIKPGQILPLFERGYLTSTVVNGERYVKLTELAHSIINSKKNVYINKGDE